MFNSRPVKAVSEEAPVKVGQGYSLGWDMWFQAGERGVIIEYPITKYAWWHIPRIFDDMFQTQVILVNA